GSFTILYSALKSCSSRGGRHMKLLLCLPRYFGKWRLSLSDNCLVCQYASVQFSPNVLSPALHLVIDDAVALAGQLFQAFPVEDGHLSSRGADQSGLLENSGSHGYTGAANP